MIPQVNKYDFYLYSDFRDGDNPFNLNQLIAHAENFVDDDSLTWDERAMFVKRKELFEIVFEDEWSSRNGKVQFFFEFSDRESIENYYAKFVQLLKEFNLELYIPNLQKSLEFYREYETEIKHLEKGEGDNWEKEIQSLEEKYKFHYSPSIELAKRFLENPNDYCRDENGEPIDPNFTGRLKHYLKNGILIHDYSVFQGQISGEFMDYDIQGNKSELSIKDGYVGRESIKRWFPNGQIEFEKINDSDCRYWYKNGQMKTERIGGVLKRWNADGQEVI